jgi:hypothetical protein
MDTNLNAKQEKINDKEFFINSLDYDYRNVEIVHERFGNRLICEEYYKIIDSELVIQGAWWVESDTMFNESIEYGEIY